MYKMNLEVDNQRVGQYLPHFRVLTESHNVSTCVCVFMYVHYTNTYYCTHAWCTHIHVCIVQCVASVCVSVCNVCIRIWDEGIHRFMPVAWNPAPMYVCVCACVYVNDTMYMHTYTYMHVYEHTHTHTHTNKHHTCKNMQLISMTYMRISLSCYP